MTGWQALRWRQFATIALLTCAWALEPRPAAASEFALPDEGTIVGDRLIVSIESDVTLYDVARHFDLGLSEIQAANPGVNPWTPRRGQRILIPAQFILPPKPWAGVVVDLAARRLYYFPHSATDEPPSVVTFPIGIGDDAWTTPLGHGAIVAKVANPSWLPPISIREEHASRGEPLPDIVPPGPNNPMGLFKLQTSFPSIYLHGTNRPWSVGDRASHGCIRLYPEDVKELFRRVPIGTPVRIIDEAYVFGTLRGTLYLSAYPRSSEGKPSQQLAVVALTKVQDDANRNIAWDRFAEAVQASAGFPKPVSRLSSAEHPLDVTLQILPYRFPPYDTDANNASEPVSPKQ